jgi:uncharacterized protein
MISVDSLYIRAKIIYMGAKSLLLLFVAIALLACFSQVFIQAASAQDYPAYQDAYVNDFANVFNAEQVSYLRSVLAVVRENTTAEVVVVTVSTVAPLEPSQYATELFTSWGIGKEKNDNGLLILYAKDEGKIWVTTGYGMEGLLPDSRIGRMLDDYYVPERDAGNVSEGIVVFTQEVAKVIAANPEWTAGDGLASLEDSPLAYVLGLPFFGILIAIFMFSPLAFVMTIIGLFVVIARRFGPKCDNDGTRMKFKGYEGNYAVFECPLCHAKKKKKRVRNYGAAAGGFAAGGFRGGGFGGGGFGGGFGGGGTGGGGAGR